MARGPILFDLVVSKAMSVQVRAGALAAPIEVVLPSENWSAACGVEQPVQDSLFYLHDDCRQEGSQSIRRTTQEQDQVKVYLGGRSAPKVAASAEENSAPSTPAAPRKTTLPAKAAPALREGLGGSKGGCRFKGNVLSDENLWIYVVCHFPMPQDAR